MVIAGFTRWCFSGGVSVPLSFVTREGIPPVIPTVPTGSDLPVNRRARLAQMKQLSIVTVSDNSSMDVNSPDRVSSPFSSAGVFPDGIPERQQVSGSLKEANQQILKTAGYHATGQVASSTLSLCKSWEVFVLCRTTES